MDGQGYRETMHTFERDLLGRALARAGGVVSKCSRELGIPRATLYERMTVLGLSITGKPEPLPVRYVLRFVRCRKTGPIAFFGSKTMAAVPLESIDRDEAEHLLANGDAVLECVGAA